jgi:hypothetical protein
MRRGVPAHELEHRRIGSYDCDGKAVGGGIAKIGQERVASGCRATAMVRIG